MQPIVLVMVQFLGNDVNSRGNILSKIHVSVHLAVEELPFKDLKIVSHLNILRDRTILGQVVFISSENGGEFITILTKNWESIYKPHFTIHVKKLEVKILEGIAKELEVDAQELFTLVSESVPVNWT